LTSLWFIASVGCIISYCNSIVFALKAPWYLCRRGQALSAFVLNGESISGHMIPAAPLPVNDAIVASCRRKGVVRDPARARLIAGAKRGAGHPRGERRGIVAQKPRNDSF
jgi:hypothetical protein